MPRAPNLQPFPHPRSTGSRHGRSGGPSECVKNDFLAMADTDERKEGFGGGRRGAQLSRMKAAGGKRSPACRPGTPPAHLTHARLSCPHSSRVTDPVPANSSLRSGPPAAAEGGPRASRQHRHAFLGHWARKQPLGRWLQNHRRVWRGGRAWPWGWDRTRINPRGLRTPAQVSWAWAGLKDTGVSARCISDSVPQVSLPPLPNDLSVPCLSPVCHLSVPTVPQPAGSPRGPLQDLHQGVHGFRYLGTPQSPRLPSTCSGPRAVAGRLSNLPFLLFLLIHRGGA